MGSGIGVGVGSGIGSGVGVGAGSGIGSGVGFGVAVGGRITMHPVKNITSKFPSQWPVYSALLYRRAGKNVMKMKYWPG